MIQLDGVTLDLTKPETLKGVTLKSGGSIQQRKDGEEVTIKNDTDKPQPASQISAMKGKL
jgi:hypothetical protein